jgi:hypothetical protein
VIIREIGSKKGLLFLFKNSNLNNKLEKEKEEKQYYKTLYFP